MNRSQQAARTRTLTRVSRVLSGELENVGTPVKRVILCNKGRACTDGESVWVPAIMNDDARLNLMMQEAVLAHEAAGHLRYTDFAAWKRIGDKIKAGEEDRLLHDFTNILEDARVNHLLSQDFAGSGKRLNATQDIFMKKHKEMWTDSTPETIDAGRASIIAMMTEAISREAHFFPHIPQVCAFMDEVRDHMVNAISQPNTSTVIKSAKIVLKVFREHFPESSSESLDNIPSGNDGEGMMLDDMSPEEIEKMAQEQKKRGAKPEEVSRSRFQELKEKAEKMAEESKKAQEAAQNDEESSDEGEGASDSNEGEEGEGNSDSGESCEGDGEGGDGEGDETDGEGAGEGEATDGEATNGEEGGDGEGENESNDATKTDDSSDSDSADKGAGGEDFDSLFSELNEAIEVENLDALRQDKLDRIEENNATSENIDGMEFEEGEIVDVSHTTQELIDRADGSIDQFSTLYDDYTKIHKTQITTLTNELKRLLKDDNKKYERYLKRGRIDSKRVAYVNGSNRIFRKRNEAKEAKVNALILIDASGSMGAGVRAQAASEAGVVLTEVMDKLGWNVEVVDFNSGWKDTSIRVRKSMKAPVNNITKAAIAMPFVGSSNGDGYAVQWSLDRLEQFDGKRMLFVISDGQPAGPSPSGMTEEQHLIHVVSNAPKNVGLFSIGIDGMDTSKYYPNHATCDARNLAKAVIPVLRKMARSIR